MPSLSCLDGTESCSELHLLLKEFLGFLQVPEKPVAPTVPGRETDDSKTIDQGGRLRSSQERVPVR